jgi:hypothetical protein
LRNQKAIRKNIHLEARNAGILEFREIDYGGGNMGLKPAGYIQNHIRKEEQAS